MSKIERYLPNDQYQAAMNANAPSAANPFLTEADLPSVTKYYGSFYDTTIQNPASNAIVAMKLNTNDVIGHGVSVTNDLSGDPTRITVANAGVYNIQFSAQLHKTSAAVGYIYIWARVSGTDVAQSAGKIALSGSQAETIAAWNYVLSMAANDYFELMWSTDDTNCQLLHNTTVSPVPAIPSVILTVQQI